MNRYTEAAAVGILAAIVTFFAGVGTGRSGASAAIAAEGGVELRPLVSGRIASINFVLEQEVRKGDVLLVVDPTPFETALNKARAELGKAQWRYEFALRQHSRAAVDRAGADVRSDKMALDAARVNLENTKVIAPISGTVRGAEVTVGSFVESGKTPLTIVVPPDQIKAVRY
jgi:membrane fusion protein, multidrug efflux system